MCFVTIVQADIVVIVNLESACVKIQFRRNNIVFKPNVKADLFKILLPHVCSNLLGYHFLNFVIQQKVYPKKGKNVSNLQLDLNLEYRIFFLYKCTK